MTARVGGRTGLAVATVVALLGAGCTPQPPAPAPTVEVTLEPSPTVTQPPEPPPTITLAFGGDVHFMDRVSRLLADPSTTFGEAATVLSAADLAVVNLETAITDRGTQQVKLYTFRAPPKALEAIKAAGIDAVSLGNNHTLDYGQVGLIDSLTHTYNAGIPTFGAGLGATYAYGPWITQIKGVKFAFLAFSQVQELAGPWTATDTKPGIAIARSEEQIARVAELVRLAKQVADVVVVVPHWGQERNPCPIAQQTSTARALVDAGADLIVGAHPHIIQGAGWMDDTYVAYSLGNFLWYSNTSNPDTGILQVTLTGSSITSVEFVPAKIHPTSGQPILQTGSEKDRILDKWDGLRDCTGLAATPAT